MGKIIGCDFFGGKDRIQHRMHVRSLRKNAVFRQILLKAAVFSCKIKLLDGKVFIYMTILIGIK